MTTIEAVYERGVFRPMREIVLEEGTHVEVLLPQAQTLHDPRATATMLAEIAAKAPRPGKPETASMDHDRILYGSRDAQ